MAWEHSLCSKNAALSRFYERIRLAFHWRSETGRKWVAAQIRNFHTSVRRELTADKRVKVNQATFCSRDVQLVDLFILRPVLLARRDIAAWRILIRDSYKSSQRGHDAMETVRATGGDIDIISNVSLRFVSIE